MADQTKSAIKTRSQDGELVDPVDNPDKAGGVKMANSDLEPSASEPEALEKKGE